MATSRPGPDGFGGCCCGASAARHLFAARDLRFGFPGEFSVVRCVGCGTVRTEPQPGDPGAYYPDDYYSFGDPPEGFFTRLRRRIIFERYGVAGRSGPEQQLARLLARRVAGLPERPGRLLDVGCGSGDTIRLLAQAGFSVAGVEPDGRAARAAKAKRLYVHEGTIEDVPFDGGTFDFVRFWHSLEHTSNPAAALRAAHRLLSPGGSLILGVPNFRSLPARLAHSRWYGLDVPRHLYHFDARSLRRLLHLCGFSVQRVSYVGSGSLAGTLDSLFAPRRLDPRLVERSWVVFALAPLEWALDTCRLGESLEVYATPG